MNKKLIKASSFLLGVIMALLLVLVISANAAIDGISVPNTTTPMFNLTAKADYISTAEGGSYLIWGFANGAGRAQYSAPTLIVNQGDTVTVNLTNELPLLNGLPVPVSIVFPGQSGVISNEVAPTTQDGPLTKEVLPGGSVSYTFTASQPGTYTYYSGTNPDLQIEMGLVGVLIVRPYGYVQGDPSTYKAYNHPDSQYRREYLFFLSEMDPLIHQAVLFGWPIDTTTFWPVYWFINGRTAPDTMSMAFDPLLPTQPYNCMPATHPGEKVLLRIVGGGRDSHPYHTHGNHVRVIARDGRLVSSGPGAGADLSKMEFTVTSAPGQTIDAVFVWTGEKMGWDIYGTETDAALTHSCNAKTVAEAQALRLTNPTDPYFSTQDAATKEYCADHGKIFPVLLPEQQFLTFGPWYSGSPFLGAGGTLPPGEGGLNPNAGFFFMWHSHNENEIVNNNIFPGGMLTMTVVEHPSVEIMD